MKLEKIKSLEKHKIKSQIEELRKTLFELRMKKMSEKKAKTHEIKICRRNIARCMTVLNLKLENKK